MATVFVIILGRWIFAFAGCTSLAKNVDALGIASGLEAKTWGAGNSSCSLAGRCTGVYIPLIGVPGISTGVDTLLLAIAGINVQTFCSIAGPRNWRSMSSIPSASDPDSDSDSSAEACRPMSSISACSRAAISLMLDLCAGWKARYSLARGLGATYLLCMGRAGMVCRFLLALTVPRVREFFGRKMRRGVGSRFSPGSW